MANLSQTRCTEYRREISDDLRSFARTSQRLSLFDGYADLVNIAEDLSGKKGKNWSYRLSNVKFSLPDSAVRWPNPASSVLCSMGLTAAGVLESCEITRGLALGITEWQMNLEFSAIDAEGSQWHQFWHFDRHLGGHAMEAHPLYHANFGGHRMQDCRMQNNNTIFTGMMEMDAPRIHLVPMDVVLIVDFILSNFDGEKWSSARRDPSYVSLVAKAQKRLWHSHFHTLCDFFTSPNIKQSGHSAIELWPNLAVSPVA